MSTLYETDFHAWTQEQGAKLRALIDERANLDLDLEHLAEEIEDMGGSHRSELHNRMAQLLEHLLKLQYSPSWEPRNGWMRSVRGQRIAIERLIRKNPSLRPTLPRVSEDAYLDAVQVFDLNKRVELTMNELPDICPFVFEQVMDPDWLPDPRHA